MKFLLLTTRINSLLNKPKNFKKNKNFSKQAYRRFIKKYDVTHFHSLTNQTKTVLYSLNELKFNSIVDFNTPPLLFKNFYGKPDFTYTSPENTFINTVVYKTKIRGMKARCSLIFYKNKLVLFNYVFTKFSEIERAKIMDYSVQKFGNKPDKINYKIIDKNNNYLIIEDLDSEITFNFHCNISLQKLVTEKHYREIQENYSAIGFKLEPAY